MYKSVTIQSGLRIYCADRSKTYSEEASGPSLHDEASAAMGRMPLQFCRRLNCNIKAFRQDGSALLFRPFQICYDKKREKQQVAARKEAPYEP